MYAFSSRGIAGWALCIPICGLLLGLAVPKAADPSQDGSRRSQPVQRSNGRQVETPTPNAPQAKGANAKAELADDYELDRWFKECSNDSNQWLSYYETDRALGFSRDRFRNFDTNADGRLDKQEFVAYYRFAAPREEFRPPRRRGRFQAPERTPAQLLLAYDSDLNGGISLSEARRILADYSRVAMDEEGLFTQVDRDQSKLLDVDELATFSATVSHLNVPQMAVQTYEGKKPFDEFFLEVISSASRTAPPRIRGPVTPFRRLDLDGNGTISPQDLENLEKSMFTGIRPQTILHTLDQNRDGVLDRNELRSSMERPKR